MIHNTDVFCHLFLLLLLFLSSKDTVSVEYLFIFVVFIYILILTIFFSYIRWDSFVWEYNCKANIFTLQHNVKGLLFRLNKLETLHIIVFNHLSSKFLFHITYGFDLEYTLFSITENLKGTDTFCYNTYK